MKKLSTILVGFLASLTFCQVMAQQRPIYDQYHFNYYLINPAVAGADKCSHFMATAKQSWLGMSGPSTELISYRTRLNSRNVGLGGYIYNDHMPDFNYVGGEFTFAYHIPLSDGSRYLHSLVLDRQLSFGVSAKIKYISYDAVSGTNSIGEDYSSDAANTSDGEFAPDIDLGVYYTSYGFFAGASATNIIPFQPSILNEDYTDEALTTFLFTGYDFDIGNNRILEPSLNFNFDANGNKQIEGNFKFSQNDENEKFGYWAELSYRHNLDKGSGKPLSLIPIVGFRFNKWQLAYALNITLNELANHNYGTHELMLGYDFCIPKRFCR